MTIYTRMGDGRRVETTKQQIYDDIHEGSADAADAAQVPQLTDDQVEVLAEIMMDPQRVVSVEPGHEIVMTEDGGPYKLMLDSGSSGDGIDMSRTNSILVHERMNGYDTFQLATADYSLKAVKPIVDYEGMTMEKASAMVTLPLMYGCMPNMGLYFAPDGPYQNPTDLMREFKMEESYANSEAASAHLANDIEFVANKLQDYGSEGFTFDTTASAGDADFVGTLNGIERLRKAHPEAYIVMGMAAESVLGIHGMMEYKGEIVAGTYPHQQVKLAEKAGVNVFGAVVNTNTSKSTSWNLARSVTMVSQCVKDSNIPVHVDLGMGVGGIPMLETPPIDAVSRCNKAMVEIAHVDGI